MIEGREVKRAKSWSDWERRWRNVRPCYGIARAHMSNMDGDKSWKTSRKNEKENKAGKKLFRQQRRKKLHKMVVKSKPQSRLTPLWQKEEVEMPLASRLEQFYLTWSTYSLFNFNWEKGRMQANKKKRIRMKWKLCNRDVDMKETNRKPMEDR